MSDRPIDVVGLKRARRWMVRGFWVWGSVLVLALPVAALIGAAGAKLQQAGMPVWAPRALGGGIAVLLLVGGACGLWGMATSLRATGSSQLATVGCSLLLLLLLLLLPIAMLSRGHVPLKGMTRGLERAREEFERLGLAWKPTPLGWPSDADLDRFAKARAEWRAVPKSKPKSEPGVQADHSPA